MALPTTKGDNGNVRYLSQFKYQYLSARCRSHVNRHFYSLRLPRIVEKLIPIEKHPYDPILFNDFISKHTLNNLCGTAALVMSSPEYSNDERYACMLLFDIAIPRVSGGTHIIPNRHADTNPFFRYSVNEGSLPALHSELAYNLINSTASISTPTTTTTTLGGGGNGSGQIGSILTKALPLRCISRHFQSMVERALELKGCKDGLLLRQIFMAGMLGVYRHCDPNSRPGAVVRCRITNMWFPVAYPGKDEKMSLANDIIYRSLFGNCWKFLMFMVREYNVFLIDGDFALRQFMNSLFDYNEYRAIVIAVNARLRMYLNEHMRVFPHATMSNPDIMVATSDHVIPAWEGAIMDIINAKQDELQSNLYRRDASSDLEMFKTVRGGVPTNLWWTIDIPPHVTIGKSHIDPDAYQMVDRKQQTLQRSATLRIISANRELENYTKIKKAAKKAENKAKNKARKDAMKTVAKMNALADHDQNETRAKRRKKLDEYSEAKYEENKNMEDDELKNLSKQLDELAIEQQDQLVEAEVEFRDIMHQGKMGMEIAAKMAYNISRAVPAERLEDVFGCRPFDGKVNKRPDVRVTQHDIIHEHSEIMYKCITSLKPDLHPTTVLEQFYDLFVECFGVPPEAAIAYRNLAIAHKNRQLTRKKWITKLQDCVMKWPYTYNLIQALADMWSKHSSVRRYNLPLHYVNNQIKAIHEQYELKAGGNIPKSTTSVWFCHICGTVYSLAQDARSTNKQSYRWGYRHVQVGMFSGVAHCRRNNKIGHLYCKSQPLSKVLILGQMLLIDNKIYMLCPQHACGMLMVVDSSLAYNERGIACCNCTNILNSIRQTEYDRQACHLIDRLKRPRGDDPNTTATEVVAKFRCYCCHHNIFHAYTLIFYGWTTYLCRTHATAALQDYVLKEMARYGLYDNKLTLQPELPILPDDDSIDVFDKTPWESRVRKCIEEYQVAQKLKQRPANQRRNDHNRKIIKAQNARHRRQRP